LFAPTFAELSIRILEMESREAQAFFHSSMLPRPDNEGEGPERVPRFHYYHAPLTLTVEGACAAEQMCCRVRVGVSGVEQWRSGLAPREPLCCYRV